MKPSSDISMKSLLADLMSKPTISDRSNLELLDYVEDHLAGFGARCRRFSSPDGTKANFFATIGPQVAGGVVLSGHTDVVPVSGQKWSVDPFNLTERDGLLFGRGSTDMKGFLAAALSIAPVAARTELARPLHFAFSYDEEVGCTGVGPMISHIAENVPRPLAVIVGEPTNMKPVAAHKGAFDWRTVVRGKAAHSSLPHLGAHAIFAGARLIDFIEQMQADFRQRPAMGTSYTIPYPTLSVGIAHGGTAGNIIPDQFILEWEARTLDAGQADEIIGRFNAFAETTVLPQLRQTASEASITSTPLFDVPPLTRIAGSDAETLAMKLSGEPLAPAVSFCTEAGLFQQAGLSTILCGPGSIDQAHQPDEYVSIDQLELCRTFLLRVLDSLTS